LPGAKCVSAAEKKVTGEGGRVEQERGNFGLSKWGKGEHRCSVKKEGRTGIKLSKN